MLERRGTARRLAGERIRHGGVGVKVIGTTREQGLHGGLSCCVSVVSVRRLTRRARSRGNDERVTAWHPCTARGVLGAARLRRREKKKKEPEGHGPRACTEASGANPLHKEGGPTARHAPSIGVARARRWMASKVTRAPRHTSKALRGITFYDPKGAQTVLAQVRAGQFPAEERRAMRLLCALAVLLAVASAQSGWVVQNLYRNAASGTSAWLQGSNCAVRRQRRREVRARAAARCMPPPRRSVGP